MCLDGQEFTRRFLLHVLPAGLQRLRHYGLLGNRCRAAKLARCRELLAMPVSVPTLALAPDPAPDYRDRYQRLTGFSLRDRPQYGRDKMIHVESFLARAPLSREVHQRIEMNAPSHDLRAATPLRRRCDGRALLRHHLPRENPAFAARDGSCDRQSPAATVNARGDVLPVTIASDARPDTNPRIQSP